MYICRRTCTFSRAVIYQVWVSDSQRLSPQPGSDSSSRSAKPLEVEVAATLSLWRASPEPLSRFLILLQLAGKTLQFAVRLEGEKIGAMLLQGVNKLKQIKRSNEVAAQTYQGLCVWQLQLSLGCFAANLVCPHPACQLHVSIIYQCAFLLCFGSRFTMLLVSLGPVHAAQSIQKDPECHHLSSSFG